MAAINIYLITLIKCMIVLIFSYVILYSGFILFLVIYYFFAIIGMETFHAIIEHKCW